MPSPDPTLSVSEPRPEQFPAGGVAGMLQRCWVAVRPGFLGAAALPVLVGTASGWRVAGDLDVASFLLALRSGSSLVATSWSRDCFCLGPSCHRHCPTITGVGRGIRTNRPGCPRGIHMLPDRGAFPVKS